MSPPRRRPPPQQAALEVSVLVDEESKLPQQPRRRAAPAVAKIAAAGGVLSIIAGVYHAVEFTTTRCYLIDWSARTRLSEVPRVKTQAELDLRIKLHEPALLHEALRDWPALRKWDAAFFGRELGATRIEVFFWGRSGADWRRTRVFNLRLGQYAKLLAVHEQRAKRLGAAAAGPAPYLQEDESLFAENEELLLPDVEHLPFRPYLTAPGSATAPPSRRGRRAAVGGGRLPAEAGTETETAFWMGPANARTGIHWDSVDAILHQLKGTKRITLWPPGARPDLYPSTKYNHGAELSQVDAASPNLTRFPRFAHADSLTVLLPAGSALYLPAGWWHAVTSLDTTISLALRSQSGCQRRAAAVDDLLQWLHNKGWYRRGDCVCHLDRLAEAAEASGGDGDGEANDGLSGAIDELLRAAGVDAHKGEAVDHGHEDDDDEDPVEG